MNKGTMQMTERVLNHAIEILYMVTGEEYIVVQKNSIQGDLHLLTGEVPIKCDDVAVYFTTEEWEYIEKHKENYKDVVMEKNHTIRNVGVQEGRSRDTFTTHMDTGTRAPQILRRPNRPSTTKKKNLYVPTKGQFNQLVHSIAKLGRRVAKIDKNIINILKEFEKKITTDICFDSPCENYVKDKRHVLRNSEFMQDKKIVEICLEELHKDEQTPHLSSPDLLLYPQKYSDPVCNTQPKTLGQKCTNINTNIKHTSYSNTVIAEKQQAYLDAPTPTGKTIRESGPLPGSSNISSTMAGVPYIAISDFPSSRTTLTNQVDISGQSKTLHVNLHTANSLGNMFQDITSPAVSGTHTSAETDILHTNLPTFLNPDIIVKKENIDQDSPHETGFIVEEMSDNALPAMSGLNPSAKTSLLPTIDIAQGNRPTFKTPSGIAKPKQTVPQKTSPGDFIAKPLLDNPLSVVSGLHAPVKLLPLQNTNMIVSPPTSLNLTDLSSNSKHEQIRCENRIVNGYILEILPDISLPTLSEELRKNFRLRSHRHPHRYAQLLFQHFVPYALYKTWTHNTNYDGSRGKRALPNNLKCVIINETSAVYRLTPAVLKKIKDTLNALLRTPRVGDWD